MSYIIVRKIGFYHYTLRQENKCGIAKADTYVNVDVCLFIKVAQVSCNFERFFENILLQDTVIEQNLYLIAR